MNRQKAKLICCSMLGFTVGVLIGYWLTTAYQELPVVLTLSCPIIGAVAGCWLSGPREPKLLAKIVAYASIGVLLGAMLQPVVVERPTTEEQIAASQQRKLINRSRNHLLSSSVSGLLVLVALGFASAERDKK